MPLVRIAVQEGQHKSHLAKIGDAVHRAMVETINVPPLDRFQIITEHPQEGFVFDPNYLNISRTKNLVMLQITMNTGRTTEMKKALFKRIAELLHEELGIRKEDVLMNLVEVAKENWSFGNGEAQYAS
jgi:phenylpyruvate tautomerase PptA (4-oxalocrotonate tautomerase family)